MKVLLIYPIPPPDYIYVDIQMGVLYLSAILKKEGHQTALLNLWKLDKRKIQSKINSFKPDLIAVSCTSDDFPLTKDIVGFIHKEHNLPMILGGIHATVAPEEAIALEGLIGICVGEGELAFADFIKKFSSGKDYTDTKNFWFKKGNKIIKNDMYPLIQDLDSLPFPDRSVVNYQELLNQDHRADFMAGRGCPYQCSYCINHYQQRLMAGKGKFTRMRSVDNLLSEIREVIAEYKNIDCLNFFDDTFIHDKVWLKEFSEKYPKSFNLPFICCGRANNIDEEVVGYLNNAGCTKIAIGVEHGNDHLRNDILKKNLTKMQIMGAFKLVNAAGIKGMAFNMLGVPYETEETIKESIEFNRSLELNNLQISMFHPYPGTDLYNLCKDKGWIVDSDARSYLESQSALNLPTISKKKIEYYHRIFRACVMYPKLSFLFILFARIPVSSKKTLYDVTYTAAYKTFFALRKKIPAEIRNPLFKLLKV